MEQVAERCPWCGAEISRAKFLEIESKIREQEQKRLSAAETEMRKRLEDRFKQDLEKQRSATEKQAQEAAQKQVAKLVAERDQAAKKLKEAEEREAAIRAQVQEAAEKKHLKEVEQLRRGLEKERDSTLLKIQAEFNRERELLQRRVKTMEQQLQKKTAHELGDDAEIDLFEALKEACPGDRITRVPKGQAGADILQEVYHRGQSCGRIIIDSKHRQAWQNGYVAKLRQDQVEAGAEHAVLASTVFPSGAHELCIESEVIVVNPARAIFICQLLRQAMIAMHLRGLSMKERAGKMSQLYGLITSESYARRFREAEKLSQEILELDTQEKRTHDNVWKKRGTIATRISNVLREIDTDVSAVIEGGHEEEQLPPAFGPKGVTSSDTIPEEALASEER